MPSAPGPRAAPGQHKRLRPWGETSEASAANLAQPGCRIGSVPPSTRSSGDGFREGWNPWLTARRRRSTPGVPSGSWSSSRTPTTPISGPRQRPRPGSTPAPGDGWCAARAAMPGPTTGRPIRSSWRRCASRSSRRRRGSWATRACRSSTSRTAPWPTTSPCASIWCARSGRSGRTRCSPWIPETLFYSDGGVNHADHRTAGLAAVDAVYPAARNPMAFPWLARDGLPAHVVRRLYLFWPTARTPGST